MCANFSRAGPRDVVLAEPERYARLVRQRTDSPGQVKEDGRIVCKQKRTPMNLPHNTLVLVADGRKMLFLRNHGEGAQIDLRLEAHREQENAASRDQGTDAPGRSFSSVGARRSAMGETDFHQIQEDRFAAEAADLLRERALSGDFESLVVVAPPRTLGELRKHYHKEVENRIVDEFHKDLTGCTVEEIEAALVRMETQAVSK